MNLSEIRKSVDAEVKHLGFVARKSTWTRAEGPFVDVLELQTSKSQDMVALNGGVLYVPVYRHIWGTEAPLRVDEALCTVRRRTTGGTGGWWRVDDENAANQIAAAVVSDALRFLTSMHSVEAMEDYLKHQDVAQQVYPLPRITLALLMYERGDKGGACSALTEVLRTTTASWRNRIQDIRTRISCDR